MLFESCLLHNNALNRSLTLVTETICHVLSNFSYIIVLTEMNWLADQFWQIGSAQKMPIFD